VYLKREVSVGLFKKNSNDSVVTKRAFARRFAEDDTVERETYHGVLRSELDEPEKLPRAFEQLIEEIGKARHAFERGDLTKVQLAEVLRNLRVVGPDGTEWTMGSSSGRWYRRPVGGTWVPSLPPEEEGYSEAGFSGRQNLRTSTGPNQDDDFLANIDELLQGGLDTFGVDESVESTDSVAPWPAVSGQGSDAEPMAYRATESSVVDESGVWSTSWEASGKSATEASSTAGAFEDLPDISAFDTLPPVDGGGWAAWGVKPD
jgi:hypothetical protein